MENQVDALCKEFSSFKENIALPKTLSKASLIKKKSCHKYSNFELENYMVLVQGFEKTHKCEICGKKHVNGSGGLRSIPDAQKVEILPLADCQVKAFTKGQNQTP